MHRKLSIDIETYSGTDLTKSGVYRYAEDEAFCILLFAYAFDDEPVQIVDIAQGEDLPANVLSALTDPSILKTAFNANFEITCISAFFGIELDANQWECTMVRSAAAGLPLSLKSCAEVLKLDQQKKSTGAALIRYFSLPCKPTKANNGRTRNKPFHDLDKWRLFKEYCVQDVETERAIYNKLHFIQIPEREHALWVLDQKINSRGVLIDQRLVNAAISMDAQNKDELTAEASDLTGLNNPNSVSQLKTWLAEAMAADSEMPSLSKQAIKDLLADGSTPDVERMLRLRQELSKTSVKKYAAMSKVACEDNRVRGLFQFYGANRTGRWSGRLVQLQNLPQNHLPDLDLARDIVRSGDIETLRLLFGNVPSVLSELIRTAFIAKEGHTFLVADYSAIEARVIAWLADEGWVLDVFKSHGKIYEATAAMMFKVPIEQVTKGSPLRARGKVAQLACGYEGGVNALTAMDTKREIQDEDKKGLITAWREANPNIVALWRTVENAALKAVRERITVKVAHGVSFTGKAGVLFCNLPSGRSLSYVRPKLVVNRFGRQSVQYEGMNQTTKRWEKVDTYGGKLTENIVQAIARDCLAEAMMNLEKAGYHILMSIHDEVVIENESKDNLPDVCRIMGLPIDWADGLPLRADGYCTKYYMKD